MTDSPMRSRTIPTRQFASIIVVLMALAACGDGSGQPIFPSDSASETSVGTATTGPPTTGPATTDLATSTTQASGSSSTTSVTTIPATDPTAPLADAPVAAIASADVLTPEEAGITGGLLGGSPDYRTGEAIAADIADSGIDLAGIEFWVMPVTGTSDRLLVMEIDDAASGLLEDEAGQLVFDALLDSPSLEGADLTLFVINYRGSDADGDFVLTSAVPIDVLLASIAAGTDVGEDLLIQFTRNGEVVE